MYDRTFALVAPESHVWGSLPGWVAASTAHVISPASGACFSMYLAKLRAGGSAGAPAGANVERLAFVLDGEVTVRGSAGAEAATLHAGQYAFFPPSSFAAGASLESAAGAGLVVLERVYSSKTTGKAAFFTDDVENRTLEAVPGEDFALRRLLPLDADHDFNVHIMDFAPGEYLNVKEVHYNQHGLLMLAGKGIYRLADNWYPVQTGDVIYMGPYVPQWYAALGTTPTRYFLFKDTHLDPLDQGFFETA